MSVNMQNPTSTSSSQGHYQINGDNLATAFSSTGSDNDVPVLNVDAEIDLFLALDNNKDNGHHEESIQYISKNDHTDSSEYPPLMEEGNLSVSDSDFDTTKSPLSSMKKACFAAGCFWGTEAFFKKEFGKRGLIHNLRVGYAGGHTYCPAYTDVKNGNTGHAEVLVFDYNPAEVEFAQLCDYFFRFHNPCTKDHQGDDKGTQYRSAIFVYDEEQRAVAEAAINQWNGADEVRHALLQKAHGAGSRIVTAICDGADAPFWDAEEYHQAHLDHNPTGECNHKMYIKARDLPIM